MKSSYLYSTLAVVGLTVVSTNAPALEPPFNLSRAVHPIDGPAEADDHGGPPRVSDACPAISVGVLNSGGGTIVGSTIGSTDDFVAGCNSHHGGQDEIFEFAVDLPGEFWVFDTCTVPACWDTTLEIREDTGGGCPGDFIACNGDRCPLCYYESLVALHLVPATTYYLIVDGWSTFSYGDFVVSYRNKVPGCIDDDADCDDGLFCNGVETCNTATGVCLPGSASGCTTFEGYSAPCDEATDSCPEPDSCFTWIAGDDNFIFSLFEIQHCPDLASWVFDDVQVSHHTTGVLDYYTTPIFGRDDCTGASPLGTPFSVDQALFSVEAGTCNPDAQIAGSQCTGTATIKTNVSPLQDLPCSGTMPLLPNNAGNFNVCEIDFFLAWRTTENCAGIRYAGTKPELGGPAAADDFGESVIWAEDCPPTGTYHARSFDSDFGVISDFGNAVVCQKPGGRCCAPNGSCSLTSETDCAAVGGSFGFTGTINGTDGGCGGDSDGDGVNDPCDPCPIDPNDDSDGDGVCDSADLCIGGDDRFDDDLDGVPDDCDVCPGSDDNISGARDDADGDGVPNCNDKCNGVDDAVFAPECEGAIPTTSQWGLIVLALLLLAGGKILFGIGAERAARP